jgi:hypothetical protein
MGVANVITQFLKAWRFPPRHGVCSVVAILQAIQLQEISSRSWFFNCLIYFEYFKLKAQLSHDKNESIMPSQASVQLQVQDKINP